MPAPVPAADQVGCTPAARARFQASDAKPTMAIAGMVAAARLYATPGAAPLSFPRHADRK